MECIDCHGSSSNLLLGETHGRTGTLEGPLHDICGIARDQDDQGTPKGTLVDFAAFCTRRWILGNQDSLSPCMTDAPSTARSLPLVPNPESAGGSLFEDRSDCQRESTS